MSKDERLEQRLQEFYDRVPDVEDALPFKDYVLKHEDSRMAWYLLGKQYADKGQVAKANYCFSQAGEIYEAFESKSPPIMPESPAAKGKRRNRRAIFATAVLAIVIAALAVPGWKAFAPAGETPALPPQASEPQVSDPQTGKPQASESAAAAEAPLTPSDAVPERALPAPGIVAAAADPLTDGKATLGELLMQPPAQTPHMLVKSSPLGRWQDWLHHAAPVAAVRAGSSPGSSVVQWFDPDWCQCLPVDSTEADHWLGGWQPVQELKLALVSAVRHYEADKGEMPASAAELAAAYPLNRMAGWTEEMDEWLRELRKARTSGVEASLWPVTPELDEAEAVPAGLWLDITEQPLEIIVDKKNHRLAVVSGNVLLRNYKVGLGGDRTPEGEFVITEKVRDPRGEPEGVFGTRGMTLSDTLYGIHGTNQPDSIEKDDSLGCIRMLTEDIEELYDLVPLGTKVTIMQEGLPTEVRVPPKRFRLPPVQDETNPHKIYEWLN